MTKLASLLLGLTIVVTPAIAQEDNTLKSLMLAHDCAPADRVLPHLQEEWGEDPFALGTAVVTLKNGEPVDGLLLMNVNPSTRTYTINILFLEDGMVCMLTSGEDFQPAQSKPKINL